MISLHFSLYDPKACRISFWPRCPSGWEYKLFWKSPVYLATKYQLWSSTILMSHSQGTRWGYHFEIRKVLTKRRTFKKEFATKIAAMGRNGCRVRWPTDQYNQRPRIFCLRLHASSPEMTSTSMCYAHLWNLARQISIFEKRKKFEWSEMSIKYKVAGELLKAMEITTETLEMLSKLTQYFNLKVQLSLRKSRETPADIQINGLHFQPYKTLLLSDLNVASSISCPRTKS